MRLESLFRKWERIRSEKDVLLFLYNNPQYNRVVDIVEHRGMAKSHVSMSVTNLEQRGMLLRTFSTSDRRAVYLSLTESAEAIAREGKDMQSQFFSRPYGGLEPEERMLRESIVKKYGTMPKTLTKQKQIYDIVRKKRKGFRIWQPQNKIWEPAASKN